MHNAIKIICERLMMNPEACVEGAVMTGWTHSAKVVIENKGGIFTEEEVNAVKDAWREAQRASYFALIVEMVGNEKAAKRLPQTEGQKIAFENKSKERQMQEMLDYAVRRDPELARHLQKLEYERMSRQQTYMSDHTGPTNWR